MVNDNLINEFFNILNEDVKRKQKSLVVLNSFILPLLIRYESSNPKKYNKLVKKQITPTKYMIFPNHHEDILHWSFFIIDPESKRVSWVDTYIPTREDAKKGIKKDAWAYSEKT